MQLVIKFTFLLWIVCAANCSYASTIILNGKNATVWLPVQLISGRVSDAVHIVKLYCNNTHYIANVGADKTFKCSVRLRDGENEIKATYKNNNTVITSDKLKFILSYHPLPVVKPFAVVEKNKVTLNATVIDNPAKQKLKYLWLADLNNPAPCKTENGGASASTVTIPAISGAYYFTLTVISGRDSVRFKTYITRDKNGLHAYDMNKDHAAWIDNAVVYEITPSAFVKGGTFNAITAKLAELKELGVNTIWLQPIYKTDDKGQGYSVTDYFALRPDLGIEAQLTNLITTAKGLHMRVILDFVPNHTSVNHPYAQDCLKYGDSSHYYNFYQRKNDGKPYSSFYHKDKNGFIDYFWGNLINLNYNNPEVQQWMLEAVKYWLVKFDIDGYRFDAMWGIFARTPKFAAKLQTELKSIKPDILLLAEDKASNRAVYANGFDAAYDWTTDTAWVSQWSWQTKHNIRKSFTIFNFPDSLKRSAMLRKAIFQNPSSVKILRFIENNDVPRFIASHTLEQTKMAAALVFALPGIPMLYNGQEIGCKLHPYSGKPIFNSTTTIQQSDSTGLYAYYKRLIQLHAQYQALTDTAINEIALTDNPYMLAFERRKGNEHLIVIINLSQQPAIAQINLSGDQSIRSLLSSKTYLQDVLTDNEFKLTDDDKLNTPIPMGGYGIRWLLIR